MLAKSIYLRSLSLSLLLLFAMPLPSAEISARASPDQITLGDSFQLVLETRGEARSAPDLSVLQGQFDILGRSQSRNLRVVNGKASSTTRLLLTLAPRVPGRLQVPAIPFGDEWSNPVQVRVTDGDARSNPVRATVTEPAGVAAPSSTAERDAGSRFVELEATPRTVYEQQQVLLTVRLYQETGGESAHLGDLPVEGGDALVRKLGEIRYQARRNGRGYQVLERRYAIYPEHSGRLRIGPIVVRERSRSEPRGSSGPTSEVVSIEVKPPAAKPWLPARRLQLVEPGAVGLRELVVGRPWTRTLVLTAEGLPSERLPPIPLQLPADFERYPYQPVLRDRVTGEGLIGSRQQRITLMPTRSGTYRLPAIEIPWWNTLEGRPESIHLAPVTLYVTEGAVASTSEFSPPAGGQSAVPGPVFGAEAPAEPSPVPSKPEVQAQAPESSSPPPIRERRQGLDPLWRRIALLLALGWALTLVAWATTRLRAHRKASVPSARRAAISPSPAPSTPPLPVQPNIDAVRKAWSQRDPQAAKQALLEWGAALWPGDPPANLNGLAQRCPPRIAQGILELDHALYSPNPGPWYAQPLGELLSHFRP